MLDVTDIQVFHGSSQALFGASLQVPSGKVVTLLGRNGMGKTTLVRAIMGLTPPRSGRISFESSEITGLSSHAIARTGIGLVPEGRQVFPNLSVKENLIATAANHAGSDDPWTLGRIFNLFPRLAERTDHLGEQLSGGEQQMLAIGRALMTNPKLLILDEATEGLAPLIRKEIWTVLEQLKQRRQSILIIDKNLDALLRIADRHYIMEKGKVVWNGPSRLLVEDPALAERYLGV